MPYEDALEIVRANEGKRYINDLRRCDGQLTYTSETKALSMNAVFPVEETRLHCHIAANTSKCK